MLTSWSKAPKALIWIRIWAAVVLLFILCWIYFDLEVYPAIKALIPLFYIIYPAKLYITNKVAYLVLPIMVNLALWIPDYRSYFFLRLALYAEQVKILFIIITSFAALQHINNYKGSHELLLGGLYVLFLILAINLAINTKMIFSLKKPINKEFFHVEDRFEKTSKWSIAAMVTIFIFTIFALSTAEHYLQLQYPPKYAAVKTENIYYEVLRYKGKVIATTRTHHYNEIEQDIGFRVQISPDNKLLLVRINLKYDEGQNLYLFDTTSLEHNKILRTPIIPNVKRTNIGYTFSQDSQEIIVGDPPSIDSHVKFQVLNIATGKIDNRFSDPKGILQPARDMGSNVTLIRLSPTGKYLVLLLDNTLEVWDYELGQPIYTQSLNKVTGYFGWLTNNRFFVGDKYNTYLYTVDSDSHVVSNKVTISSDLFKGLNPRDVGENRYQAMINIIDWGLFRLDRVDVWDTKNGKVATSIYCRGKVQEIKHHQDGKRLVVFEKLRNRTGRITIWNIPTGEKLKEMLVPPIEWSGSIKIVDNGKKILLIGKQTHLIEIE